MTQYFPPTIKSPNFDFSKVDPFSHVVIPRRYIQFEHHQLQHPQKYVLERIADSGNYADGPDPLKFCRYFQRPGNHVLLL